jgi:hypothetical protein
MGSANDGIVINQKQRCITVIIDELFNILHNFPVSTTGLNGHVGEGRISGYGGGLGVKNKGDSKESLDEFDKCISTVSLDVEIIY